MPTDEIDNTSYTTRAATSRKSVDLTTLSGWSYLSTGSHNITIVAKADGYRDSEPSAAVSVEKATGYNVSLIYTDDFVSGIFAYSLDGGTTYQDITTSDIRLTNVTQIRLKSRGLDAGTEIFQAEYGISTPSGTSISPPIGGSADKNPYELDNIILTADTGFFFYTYYD